MVAYAELQVTTNFSFLRGASHPEELVLRAAKVGLAAIAVTDRNSLAGVVRAHVAARELGIRLVVGARLDLTDESCGRSRGLLCFPTDRAAYGRLSRLLSLGQRRAAKGGCRLTLADALAHAEGLVAAAVPPDAPDDGFSAFLRALAPFAARYLIASRRHRADDAVRLARLAALAGAAGTPLLATNDVLYHDPARRPLQDVLACVREHTTIDQAGFRLEAHAERHLKPPAEMARLFRGYPDALARTLEVADACNFSLDELRYDYPIDPPPDGLSPQAHLERLAWRGAAGRYPKGVPAKVSDLLERELALIERLGYAPYFLTVHDIVRFAREQGILCQGRGSAANSAVCFCLGITAVDPERFDLLFERFVSAERNEPPDIDVDFEHERREEVIQYIYAKYGREHAGLAATVIRYRARSAIRDVGKALGLSLDVVGSLAASVWSWGEPGVADATVREIGLDPTSPRLRLALDLARSLRGFPRHLSQHVGGFVLTRSRLDEVVPVVNAAMPERTMVEWDKDDLDALGILKIDVLALGMLTCIRKSFELLARHKGVQLDLAAVPPEDPAVYAMLGRADSVGVFQVESRAQMGMLPRLKPREFYDLVIEVAIVRPGPIQGDMVHPYLRRREGKEAVDYPSPELREVLGKTLGVPLFQEQAMRIAIVAAGFTPPEADRLRRSMATFRHAGTIHRFRDKFIGGMVRRGYDPAFAERCFAQIEGFGTYGFPESHAASFALLVYVSAWLKCRHPEVFTCALLNSQPMGFYAPAQLVRDAREHGVEVRPVDVNRSEWDCTLEPGSDLSLVSSEGGGGSSLLSPPGLTRGSMMDARIKSGHDNRGQPRRLALRLGFRLVKGLSEAEMRRLVERRGNGYPDLAELRRRARLSTATLDRLARADALRSLSLDRRGALWAAIGLDGTGREAEPPPLFAWAEGRAARPEPEVALPAMSAGEAIAEDYASLHLSLRGHPLALLRPQLEAERRRHPPLVPAARLRELTDGVRVAVAGLTIIRQRPGTASGVIFATIEDETGVANLIVWPSVFERHRRAVLAARLLLAEGQLQRQGEVIHVIAERLTDRTDLLSRLGDAGQGRRADGFASRDFR